MPALTVAVALSCGSPSVAAPRVDRQTPSPVATVTAEQLQSLPDARRIEDLLRTCPATTIPTVSIRSATGGGGNGTGLDCVQPVDLRMIEVYRTHNAVRAEFGAAPLRWNPVLARNAQDHANFLGRTGRLVHASRSGRGTERENISQGLLGWNAGQMLGNWLDERKYFVPGIFPDVTTSGDWTQIGHFSQMIWPTTTDIGCGLAAGSGFNWLVCRYDPGGNKDGKPVGLPPVEVAGKPAVEASDPAPKAVAARPENFRTQRRVAFCGHMWIIIDDFDEKGNKVGELSLHFSPDGFTINPTRQDFYPKGFAFAVESTRAADLRLLEMWRYQAANRNDVPVDLPLIGPWSPVNNCITQSIMWAWYGIEPNEPVRKSSEWPVDCEITPEPDWAEKKRRLGLAWDRADTVSEHVDVMQMAVKQAFGAAIEHCFGSDDD